jgi:magnesium-transporting ATPase (P-type)
MFGSLIVIIFLTYYSFYFFTLIKKKNRDNIQKTNNRLDELRNKAIKTIEEQKEFINLKYPKKDKFKWQWIMIIRIVGYVIAFAAVFQFYAIVFSYFKVDLPLWFGILCVMVLPIIINLFLERFNLEKNDLRAFLGWKKRKQ